jgi:hypothetical protein
MGTRWLIIIVAIGIVAVALVTNATAQGETLQIVYDIKTKQIVSVKDGKTGQEAKQYEVINGIPSPLRDQSKVWYVDFITILSDIRSPGCSCAGNKCVGDTCP